MPLTSAEKNHFLIELAESDRTSFGRVDFSQQPEAQKVFSAIWALESQVNNGGFAQYFASSDGDTANYVTRALRSIGATSCAAIVERALAVVATGSLPDSQAERGALLDNLDDDARDALSQLDSAFFVYPDDLTDLLFAYVAEHPEAFGPVPHR